MIQRRYTKGITLIEVLISIVVLSIGLLGIAGLQAAATKYKINTWARSAISTLSSDFADRVRINADVSGSNFATGVTETSLYVVSDNWATQQADTLATPSPNCLSASCTTAERAAFDLIAWRQRIRTEMPQGSALVSGDRLAGFNLTFMWYDKEFTDKGNASDSVVVSSSTCTGSETGLAQQTCCPAAAAAPSGVRCATMRFIP